MNRYKITFDKVALKQMKQLGRFGRKTDVDRVNRFIEEIRIRPTIGTGKPKQLKHHKGEVWSRKINDKDRFVYRIFEEEKTVLVVQVLGHYNDK